MTDAPVAECVLYWLFDDSCVCFWRHGYIGISRTLRTRLKNHRRNKTFPKGFSCKVLFRGTFKDCQQFEWRLRPTQRIGWNYQIGGGKNRFDTTHDAATRQRMSEAAKQRPPMSDATRELFRIASTGRTNRGRIGQKKSDAERAKISASHVGRKLSSEHIAKMAATKIGNQYRSGAHLSDQSREQIRLKKLGVAIHSDEHKQKLAERMKGNAFTKGKPWSAARRLAWLQQQEQ